MKEITFEEWCNLPDVDDVLRHTIANAIEEAPARNKRLRFFINDDGEGVIRADSIN